MFVINPLMLFIFSVSKKNHVKKSHILNFFKHLASPRPVSTSGLQATERPAGRARAGCELVNTPMS